MLTSLKQLGFLCVMNLKQNNFTYKIEWCHMVILLYGYVNICY